jgi:small-conductance mechanosensitive channel
MATRHMTSTEFAAARQRLGWTALEAAVEYNMTPSIIEEFERGSVKIPKAIARDIRFRSAMWERQQVLAASGLPECSVRVDLDRAAIGKKGNDLIAAIDALVAHVKSCALCRERSEYAEQHGPPLPDVPMSMLLRIAGWANALLNRLPGAIRPPEGKAGYGRRIGFGTGGAVSAFVCAMALLFTIDHVTHVGWDPQWFRDLAPLGLIIPGYFVGFYLAGWAWDALRPIHDRFIGYVLRYGLAGIAIYGVIAVIMPFLDDNPMSLQESLGFIGFIAGIWSLIGAGLWIKDRLWGKLANRS